MLDKMIEHFKQWGNKSLLARIYGVFSLKTNIFSNLDIIVMQNSVQMIDPMNHKMTFDLKGSRINRYVKLPDEEKSFWKQSLNQRRVMKDLNLLEIEQSFDSQLLQVDSSSAHQISFQLEKDVEFLSEFKIMDYSLLLVVESLDPDRRTIESYDQKMVHKSKDYVN